MKITPVFLCLTLTVPVLAHKDDLPDYRSQNHGIELPKAAEMLLLERIKAKKIVALRALAFEHSGGHDYLGVYAAFEIDWGFERVWHPLPFVLKKETTEKDWAKAKVYRLKEGTLRQFFGKPERDWPNELEEVKPAK